MTNDVKDYKAEFNELLDKQTDPAAKLLAIKSYNIGKEVGSKIFQPAVSVCDAEPEEA
jgi:hypothetical protein